MRKQYCSVCNFCISCCCSTPFSSFECCWLFSGCRCPELICRNLASIYLQPSLLRFCSGCPRQATRRRTTLGEASGHVQCVRQHLRCVSSLQACEYLCFADISLDVCYRHCFCVCFCLLGFERAANDDAVFYGCFAAPPQTVPV